MTEKPKRKRRTGAERKPREKKAKAPAVETVEDSTSVEAPADESDTPEAGALTTPQYPYLCPGGKYPIMRAVCLGRQERNYDPCVRCEHAIRERRPRQSDF